MLLCSDLPPPPDAFRDDLASIKWHLEELGSEGPTSFCFQSPLSLAELGEGCKFEHEDSVQIAVTLVREKNQGQDREKELD